MIPGQQIRKGAPRPTLPMEGSPRAQPGLSTPPLSQVRSGDGQVLLMLAILETGLLMLGILHNFIDLFST